MFFLCSARVNLTLSCWGVVVDAEKLNPHACEQLNASCTQHNVRQLYDIICLIGLVRVVEIGELESSKLGCCNNCYLVEIMKCFGELPRRRVRIAELFAESLARSLILLGKCIDPFVHIVRLYVFSQSWILLSKFFSITDWTRLQHSGHVCKQPRQSETCLNMDEVLCSDKASLFQVLSCHGSVKRPLNAEANGMVFLHIL